MPLPAFATVEELAARIPGGVSDADEPRAQAALDDASTLIRGVAGEDWTSSGGALDFGDIAERQQDQITLVCISAAKRAYLTPTGVRSETLGDAAQTYADRAGEVYLTDEEAAVVRAVASGATTSSGFSSIDLEIGTPGWSGDVIAVSGQDEPLPFTYEPLRP